MSYDVCEFTDGGETCDGMAVVTTIQGAKLCNRHAQELMAKFGAPAICGGHPIDSAALAGHTLRIGQHGTGILVSRAEAPADALPQVREPEPDIRVYKRDAKKAAEELTKSEVRCTERGPYCQIRVKEKTEWVIFQEASWWLALRALNAYLTKKNEKAEAAKG